MNQLYYGDNLSVLTEHFQDGVVDLIYLDPPFKSNRDYNLLFRDKEGSDSEAQITAFKDTWQWGRQAEDEFREIVFGSSNTQLALLLRSFRDFLGANDMMAYITMMARRLIELHRVLKPSGSLYLHCDPTASHYLKIIMDVIFGKESFRNEIAWKRTPFAGSSKSRANQYPRSHDILLFYTKSEAYKWNRPVMPYSDEYKERFKYDDGDGRGRYRKTLLKTYSQATFERLKKESRLVAPVKTGAKWSYKQYMNDSSGSVQVDDFWMDINAINPVSKERLGYPTQKPLALLERIIMASSNPGDLVLDPFCGCGTAVHAAEKLSRAWAGIDITHLAIALIEKRMKKAFPEKPFVVLGTPKDFEGAKDLAKRDKYQFQWWACSLVGAHPYQGKRKGADHGIDGMVLFQDEAEKTKKIIVSVKGGETVTVSMIRDLVGVLDRESAQIGLFVTLAKPTRAMLSEALSAGSYSSPHFGNFPRIQLLTIEGLLNGNERALFPDLTQGQATFRMAKREIIPNSNGELF